MVEERIFGCTEYFVEIVFLEGNVAQTVVFFAVPSSMPPRPHDEKEAVGTHGARKLPVGIQCSIQVFGIKPSAAP